MIGGVHKLIERSRRHEKVPNRTLAWRCIVTVIFSLVSLLLVFLWIRSSTWRDRMGFQLSGTKHLRIDSSRGFVQFETYGPNMGEWGAHASSVSHRDISDAWQRAMPFISEPNDKGWQWESQSDGRYFIHLPHWFLIVTFAAVAAAPWIGWKFSLRTIFIFMTLFAVIISLLVVFS
jgi:hypothetical protein